MPRRRKARHGRPQGEEQTSTEPAQASASEPTSQPKQAKQQVGKSPRYDGNLERLFSALHGLVRSAEANFNLVVQVFLKYRRQAGLGEVKEIESVKEILSRKRENEGLKETEASLARTIEIFDYDKELFDSIQALIGAVHEFSKPPCFLTRKQYDKCVKSLEEIRTVVAGPFVDRQSSLAAFPEGEEWRSITRYFYDYTIYAVDTATKNLDTAFHEKHHSDPNEQIWIKEAKRFEGIIGANKELLGREDLDQAGLRYRRDINGLLDKAKHEVLLSKSADSVEKPLDKLYHDIKTTLDDFKTHVNHLLTPRLTASLAHIPVSRRSSTLQ